MSKWRWYFRFIKMKFQDLNSISYSHKTNLWTLGILQGTEISFFSELYHHLRTWNLKQREKLFQFSFLNTKFKLTMVKIHPGWKGKGDLHHKNFIFWETSKKFYKNSTNSTKTEKPCSSPARLQNWALGTLVQSTCTKTLGHKGGLGV